ncbi:MULTISPECIES: universal stress protein [unclassified Methylophaga]|jgi:nucleotide-binding universal stress UspA family protein|uniref:universal stress protein n=1 Tax=unclassified Methylophaga TaxID=2629249 RepID=UPI000C8D3801|nr:MULTISPECIES: universal stress protein [unclassified Methylophaga]MAK67215.1 universal stress protein UspA [Methylophaga sp.]MAK68210.1 universal stress protein UspA [Methylophaga sp.]MAY18253.1 universal stress protein UspA [Methylophaga sp.]HCD06202.1 universal stress protein UspA [Methylophaga sp.]|tara:strand:+ start:3337 stop:4200 length:864 start_codon:yes stop_codon:yes gene_type:complete
MTKIIACIDGSITSPAVCKASAWVSYKLKAPVDLLHVLDKTEYPTAENRKKNLSGNIGLGSRENLLEELVELDEKRGRLALEHGKNILQDARALAQQHGAVEVTTHQRHGGLMETLSDLQDDTRVLVLGRQGQAHENETHSLGSHLENVIRALNKPILITLPDFNVPQRFMIAYDGSATSNKALEKVAVSDLLKGLECHIVMVAEDDTNHKSQLETAKQRLNAAGFEASTALLQGAVQPSLHQYQRDNNIDLMVMGAYGHSRIRQFLVGSNTAKMVRMSDIPILLLR